MRGSDSCRSVSPCYCARPAIPPRVWAFAPAPPRRRRGEPGGLGFGTSRADHTDEGERRVSPVAGEPWWTFALFLDPDRISAPGPCGVLTRPLRSFRRWARCAKLDFGAR